MWGLLSYLWGLFATVSFIIGMICFLQHGANFDILCGLWKIPQIIGGTAFTIGVFSTQTIQQGHANNEIAGQTYSGKVEILARIDYIQELIEANKQLKLEIREIALRTEESISGFNGRRGEQ